MAGDGTDEGSAVKRELETETAPGSPNKKIKSEDDAEPKVLGGDGGDKGDSSLAFVPPGTVGVTTINDNDVLSGRGGGTNLHPGNRQFRDLINLYRRDYLKARKNDKPAISRSIVNAIREKNGRFLKKIEKSGLWFEIGDDAAREKTSQALRQRAPEMRKLLLDHEMEGARAQQQHMMMGMPGVPPLMMPGMNMPLMMPNGNMAFNPAMMGMPNAPMFNPAMMGMPPLNFNQQGMPQQGMPQQGMPQQPQAPGAMPNGGGDGSNAATNNNPNGEGTNSEGNGGGDGSANNNPNGNNAGANVNPMAAMNMAAMGQMNPAAMGMNPMMGQMQNMGGAPGPESPAPVQPATM